MRETRSLRFECKDLAALPVPVQQRLFAKLNKNVSRSDNIQECWEWTRAKVGRGYGKMLVKAKRYGFPKIQARSHRVAFLQTHGYLPPSLFVLHKCDNPQCCNPAHLFLGDHEANMQDAVQKRRMAHGENHPKVKFEEDVVRYLSQMGYLTWKQCQELASRLGVSTRTVWSINRGDSWRHLERPKNKKRFSRLTAAEVRKVLAAAPYQPGDKRRLAQELGCSLSTIKNVIARKCHRNVSDPRIQEAV